MTTTQTKGCFTELSGAHFEVGDFINHYGRWFRLDGRLQIPVEAASQWKQRFVATPKTGPSTVIDVRYEADYQAYTTRSI